MKENAIKFLYAFDCYLLYALSGVISSIAVVVYYSIVAAQDFGGLDSNSFFEYIGEMLSGKDSLVLLVSYLLVIFGAVLIFGIKKIRLSSYTGLSYSRPLSIISSLLLGVVLNLAISQFAAPRLSGEETLTAVLALCIILGPFVEEFMFRGVLLKMFGASVGIVFSIIITSALFAVSHGSVIQIAYTFVLGIILAVVRYKSTSLWSPIVLHMSFNVTGAVAGYLNSSFSKGELAAIICLIVLFFVLSCTGGRMGRRVSKKAG